MKMPQIVATLIAVGVIQAAHAEVISLPGKISLPEGWAHTKLQGVDSSVGKLTRQKDSLTISYDIGMLAGLYVKPEDQQKYAWYLEQDVRGHKVRLALAKAQDGNQSLMITFVDATANFNVPVKTMDDVAEVMAIILSFDYTVPAGKEGKMLRGPNDP